MLFIIKYSKSEDSLDKMSQFNNLEPNLFPNLLDEKKILEMKRHQIPAYVNDGVDFNDLKEEDENEKDHEKNWLILALANIY